MEGEEHSWIVWEEKRWNIIENSRKIGNMFENNYNNFWEKIVMTILNLKIESKRDLFKKF